MFKNGECSMIDVQMIIGIVTSICTIAAVVAAILTFNVAKESFHADHKRRKLQATLEYYGKLSNTVTVQLKHALSKVLNVSYAEASCGKIPLAKDIWKGEPDLQEKLLVYCRNMEHFAVGIKEGIFDFDTFYYVAGKTTIDLFTQISPVIDDIITANRGYSSDFCCAYKSLCKE